MPNFDSLNDTVKMPWFLRSALFLALCAPLALAGCDEEEPEPPPDRVPGGPTLNGLDLPDFRDWPVIGVASRTDNGTVRAITGNQIAVDAARAGMTDPWPDGAVIADLVWAGSPNEQWADALSPSAFNALVIMVKNAEAYADDGGWKYGSWAGLDLTASNDPLFDRDCVQCHIDEAPNNDFVFARVQPLPDINVAGQDAPNGVAYPTGWQDWAVMGVADRQDGTETVRVIVGNQTAVDAARTKQPGDVWPDGSAIADIVWAPSTNPDWEEMKAPGDFVTMVYMIKDAALYPDAGGWGYGQWLGAEMTPADPGFDADCIQCHLDDSPATDFVFTPVGYMP